MVSDNTANLQRSIDLMQQEFEQGREQLLGFARQRLLQLTGKILNEDWHVLHGETESIHADVLRRLSKALESTKPITVRHFINIAAQHIRYAIITRAGQLERMRQHEAAAIEDVANEESRGRGGLVQPGTTTLNPQRLAQWTEFQKCINELPDEHREIIDLVFYAGQSWKEAAETLGISITTLQGRWRRARAMLAVAARDTLPGSFLQGMDQRSHERD